MTIVCDECAARYVIADEKVRGRTCRVRCRKCAHQMLVRGDLPREEDAAPPGEPTIVDGRGGAEAHDPDAEMWQAASAPPPEAAPWQEPIAAAPAMAHQRNESSQLFSLDNLQALGAVTRARETDAPALAPAATRRTEGSGLIDIRAMAAAQIARTPAAVEPVRRDEAPMFAPLVAAPILVPQTTMGAPRWVWGVLSGSAILVAAIVTLVAVQLRRPGPAPANMIALAPPNAAPARSVPLTLPLVAKSTSPENSGGLVALLPPIAPAAPRAAVVRPATPRAPATQPRRPERAATTGTTARPPSTSPSPPDPERAPSRPTRGGDIVGDIFEEANKAQRAREAKTEKPAEVLPAQLTRTDVSDGMRAIKPGADACFAQYHAPGTALAQVVIAPSGKVQSASVIGVFAETPTGNCVARAARSAAFKRFSGAPMTVQWPFILR